MKMGDTPKPRFREGTERSVTDGRQRVAQRQAQPDEPISRAGDTVLLGRIYTCGGSVSSDKSRREVARRSVSYDSSCLQVHETRSVNFTPQLACARSQGAMACYSTICVDLQRLQVGGKFQQMRSVGELYQGQVHGPSSIPTPPGCVGPFDAERGPRLPVF